MNPLRLIPMPKTLGLSSRHWFAESIFHSQHGSEFHFDVVGEFLCFSVECVSCLLPYLPSLLFEIRDKLVLDVFRINRVRCDVNVEFSKFLGEGIHLFTQLFWKVDSVI